MATEEDVLELLQRQIDSLKESRQQQLQLNADKAAAEAALRNAAIQCAQGLVKLNVGGVKYTTSLTTLIAVPDSFFASLFSGDWQSTRTAEGDIFVDRDGELFKHVLQYLRAARDQQPFACGTSLSVDELAAIAAEARFYGLADLESAAADCHNKAGNEYKYLTIRNNISYVYEPKATVTLEKDNSCTLKYVQVVNPWQAAGVSYYCKQPSAMTEVGTWDLGPDPGNLLHLHREGWEFVHSSGELYCNGMIILRRRL